MMIFAKIAKESVITRTFPFGGGVPNVTSLGERQLEDLYSKLASYPGSNYAGEGKRAWYLPLAEAPII